MHAHVHTSCKRACTWQNMHAHVDNPEQYFFKNSSDGPNKFVNLDLSPTDMEKACCKLRANAAPGPDGVLAMQKVSVPASLYTVKEFLGQCPSPLCCYPCTWGRESSSFRELLASTLISVCWDSSAPGSCSSHGCHGHHNRRPTWIQITQLLAHWDSIIFCLEHPDMRKVLFVDHFWEKWCTFCG